MLMAPSNEPARNGNPSPKSPSIKSPSTSRSFATSTNSDYNRYKIIKLTFWMFYLLNIDLEMSIPTQTWPSSSMHSPDNPDPQPKSKRNEGWSGGSANSSKARPDISFWMAIIRELKWNILILCIVILILPGINNLLCSVLLGLIVIVKLKWEKMLLMVHLKSTFRLMDLRRQVEPDVQDDE